MAGCDWPSDACRGGLKLGLQADRDTARRPEGGAGKQRGEVDDGEPIREVPDVRLQPDGELRRLHDNETTRGVQGERRTYASPCQIDAIDNSLAILRDRLRAIPGEFERQTAAVRDG